MTTHAPVHPRTGPFRKAEEAAAHGLLAVLTARPFLITLALAALWVGLSTALALVAQRVFGMDALAAWAYAIGIVSYMYLFTGFVVGLVYLVRKDQGRTDGAEARPDDR